MATDKTKKKKEVKVRDLKPSKDAKGGSSRGHLSSDNLRSRQLSSSASTKLN